MSQTENLIVKLMKDDFMDERVDAIVKMLFEYTVPDDLELPIFDEHLFEIDCTNIRPPKWGGILVGEALTGFAGGHLEIAHIDLLVGTKEGPIGTGFVNALARQQNEMNNLLGILHPNYAIKPSMALVTKVKTNSVPRATQMFGPAAEAASQALMDCVAHGFFHDCPIEDLVIVNSVFIHPWAGVVLEDNKPKRDEQGKLIMLNEVDYPDDFAASNHRLWCFNYVATVAAMWMAVTGGRSPQALVDAAKTLRESTGHVFRGFKPKSVVAAEGQKA